MTTPNINKPQFFLDSITFPVFSGLVKKLKNPSFDIQRAVENKKQGLIHDLQQFYSNPRSVYYAFGSFQSRNIHDVIETLVLNQYYSHILSDVFPDSVCKEDLDSLASYQQGLLAISALDTLNLVQTLSASARKELNDDPLLLQHYFSTQERQANNHWLATSRYIKSELSDYVSSAEEITRRGETFGLEFSYDLNRITDILDEKLTLDSFGELRDLMYKLDSTLTSIVYQRKNVEFAKEIALAEKLSD